MKEQELDDMLLVSNVDDDEDLLMFDRGDSNTNSLFDNLDLVTPKELGSNKNGITMQ